MRRVALLLAVVATSMGLFGACKRQEQDASVATRVDLTFEPSPPTTGNAEVTLKIADEEGNPLDVTGLQVEGNMNHAGMKPSFAKVSRSAPGTYKGTLDFTMGGDWFVLVTGKLPDGRRLEEKIDVPGVEAP